MKISARQLEVFVFVAKYSNVTRASESLNLSQSAVSMALGELEKQLEETLFDRIGKSLTLNESGRLLLPKAIKVISQIKEIQTTFEGDKNKLAGDLRIGASATIGNYILPDIISQYIDKHPYITIFLDIKNTDKIIESILNFNLDFAIVEGFCQRKELNAVSWKKDEMAIVSSPNHPLAKKKTVTAKDLSEQQWVLREVGAGPREFFESSIAGKIENISISLELGNTEAIKHTRQNGLGIACLSRTTIKSDLAQKKLVVIKTPFLKLDRYFHMITHKKKYNTGLLESFITACKLFVK